MNTQNMNCPVFYCIGNHDLVAGTYGEELFESLYGPVYYSFEAGNVHYIVTPMFHGDYNPSYTVEEVAAWLKNDLAQVPANKPIVIFNHDLLSPDRLGLEKYNVKGWLYGHWHINYMKQIEGMTAIGTGTPDKGGIDHSMSAYRVVTADGKGNLTSDLRYSYIKNHLRIASIHAGEIPLLSNGRVPLVVNTYSSVSPVKKVNYTITRTNKQVIRKGELTPFTDWSWGKEIPGNDFLKEKELILNISVLFRNGETVETEEPFRISDLSGHVVLKEEWTNLLGTPQHTGFYPSISHNRLALAWVKNIKANIYMASPLLFNGKVFVATVDENLRGEGAFVRWTL